MVRAQNIQNKAENQTNPYKFKINISSNTQTRIAVFLKPRAPPIATVVVKEAVLYQQQQGVINLQETDPQTFLKWI